jgi:hypothetical protein
MSWLFNLSQPDLVKFTHTAWFSRLEAASVAWCDGRFAKVHQDAPWLSPYGEELVSFCRTSYAQQGVLRRGIPGVACIRMKTVIYGFDGELMTQLRELAEVLSMEGWTSAVLERTDARESPRPGPVILRNMPARMAWDPAHATPPSSPEMPAMLRESSTVPSSVRSRFRMEIAWASRATSVERVRSLAAAAGWPRNETSLQHIVNLSGNVLPYVDRVLERNAHVLAVRVSVVYYTNPNTNRFELPR